jgi:two-component system, chemotaxis family, response regulator Rcp1
MPLISEILVVDDNPADSDLTADVLGRNGCKGAIHSVKDGVEAIAFLRRQGKYAEVLSPDLIILDLNMPRKDGRAVLAEVKVDPVLRIIPIIVFTTSQAPQDVSRSYELGANCYVNKPGNLAEFVLAVTSFSNFWFCCACLPSQKCPCPD